MRWKTKPTQWEMVETTLVMPRTETRVSEPVISAVFRRSKLMGGCLWTNIKESLESQNILRTLGTCSLNHSASRKVLRP